MAWTAVGVAGIVCLVAAALIAFGPAAALAVAGVALILAAVDARAERPRPSRAAGRVEVR